MKRKLSPRKKNELAYDRDDVTLGFKSGSRKAWRKREAAAERAHPAWRVATHELAQAEDHDSLYPEGRIRRKELGKGKPFPVREVVTIE